MTPTKDEIRAALRQHLTPGSAAQEEAQVGAIIALFTPTGSRPVGGKPTREQVLEAIDRAYAKGGSIYLADEIMALFEPPKPAPNRWIVEIEGNSLPHFPEGVIGTAMRLPPMPTMDELKRVAGRAWLEGTEMTLIGVIRAVLTACGLEAPK